MNRAHGRALRTGTQRFKQRPPTAGLLFSDRNGHFVLRAGLRAHEGQGLRLNLQASPSHAKLLAQWI
ncbi:hypothetical protein EMIT0P294_10335 [Pseudomonas sp. IT-P294]